MFEITEQEMAGMKESAQTGHDSSSIIRLVEEVQRLRKLLAAKDNLRLWIEARAENERLRHDADSYERQLVQIATYLGKDARQAPDCDASIAGLVESEVSHLRKLLACKDAEAAVYKNAAETFDMMACKWASKHGTEKEMVAYTDASNAIGDFIRTAQRERDRTKEDK